MSHKKYYILNVGNIKFNFIPMKYIPIHIHTYMHIYRQTRENPIYETDEKCMRQYNL